MTERFDILYTFLKKCKKVVNKEVTENLSENVQKLCFFGSCDFSFNFFAIFSKMRRTIYIYRTFSNFVFN